MIILLFCLTGEKGDGPKFIMWVELFLFVKNFIVEINGLYVVFAYFSPPRPPSGSGIARPAMPLGCPVFKDSVEGSPRLRW